MYYIQYFEKGAVSGNIIEACGDRAVVILDGRNSLETMKQDAINFNGYKRPIYAAYQIRKGECFTRSNPLTEIINIQA